MDQGDTRGGDRPGNGGADNTHLLIQYGILIVVAVNVVNIVGVVWTCVGALGALWLMRPDDITHVLNQLSSSGGGDGHRETRTQPQDRSAQLLQSVRDELGDHESRINRVHRENKAILKQLKALNRRTDPDSTVARQQVDNGRKIVELLQKHDDKIDALSRTVRELKRRPRHSSRSSSSSSDSSCERITNNTYNNYIDNRMTNNHYEDNSISVKIGPISVPLPLPGMGGAGCGLGAAMK